MTWKEGDFSGDLPQQRDDPCSFCSWFESRTPTLFAKWEVYTSACSHSESGKQHNLHLHSSLRVLTRGSALRRTALTSAASQQSDGPGWQAPGYGRGTSRAQSKSDCSSLLGLDNFEAFLTPLFGDRVRKPQGSASIVQGLTATL